MRTLTRTVGRKSMGGEPLPSCSPCGSVAGYRLHTKEKTVPCQPCKDARNAYRSEYRAKNPTVSRTSQKRWRDSNKEKVALGKIKYRESHADQIKVSRSIHLEENRSRINEGYKEYRRNNPEKVRNTLKAWRERNPEYMQRYSHIRKAYKLGVPSEPYTVRQILDLWGEICHICKVDIDLNAPRRAGIEGWEMGLHLDHVIPISKGGADTKENVKPSHALCNLRKHDLLVEVA